MKRLMPLRGVDNVSDDESMSSFGKEPFVKLRDAVNVDITASGRVQVRRTGTPFSGTAFKNVWTSPLHHHTFATLNGELVRVNTDDWSYTGLGVHMLGNINFMVVNNYVIISDSSTLYKYDGVQVQKLTISTPPAPMATPGSGNLAPGMYNLAISWSKDGRESALSDTVSIEVEGGIDLILPYNYDADADSVTVYMTERNGSELLKVATLAIHTTTFNITHDKDLTRAVQFKHLSPMRTGKFLKFWRGRIITADKNIINFSQALNFHLFDERYDFIAMPQRITFIEPVENGLWVGQSNTVIFLSGSDVNNLAVVQTGAKAPVPGTALRVNSDLLGELSAGMDAVIWLAENGYCIGNASGNLFETHRNTLKGISGKSGQSVRFDDRIVTVIR